MTQKEAEHCVYEYMKSMDTVMEDIKDILLIEKDKNKKDILTKLLEVWNQNI